MRRLWLLGAAAACAGMAACGSAASAGSLAGGGDVSSASDGAGAADSAGASDGAGASGKCGNGTCEAAENVDICPIDCSKTYQATIACMASSCSAEWAGCSADPQCFQYLSCIVQCDCDKDCSLACFNAIVETLPASVVALDSCSKSKACPKVCN